MKALRCHYCDQVIGRSAYYCSPECRQKFKAERVKSPVILTAATTRIWQTAAEFPNYEVSNDGRVRRRINGSNSFAGKPIKITLTPNGYPICRLSGDGHRTSVTVHKLVGTTFLPPAPDGKPHILHRDDNKLNACADNLKWGNPKDNAADALKNGKYALDENHPSAKKPWTRPRGSGHPRARLTEDQARCIFSDDRPLRTIAADYGVDQSVVGRIKKGVIWKQVTQLAYQKMLEDGAVEDSL